MINYLYESDLTTTISKINEIKGYMKQKFFLLLLLVSVNSYAQNCILSDQQQNLINRAKESISYANANPSFNSDVDLINNCSKVLEFAHYCPDVHYFYDEIIKTYINLSKDKSNPSELYFYEQAINYCNRYLYVLTNDIQKDAYSRLLKDLNENYRNREILKQNERVRINDDETFEFAKKFHSIESYRAYLDAFPNGLYTPEAKRILSELVTLKYNREENQYYEYVAHENKKDYYIDYLVRFPYGPHANEVRNKIKAFEGNDIRDKDNSIKDNSINESQLYGKIKGHIHDTKVDCELYTRKFPKGEKIYEVKDILYNMEKGNALAKSNKKEAKSNNVLDPNLIIPDKTQTGILVNEVDKCNDLEKKEKGFSDKNYYSYIFESPLVSDKDNNSYQDNCLSQGISFHTLRNKGWGYYFSYKATNAFYSKTKDIDYLSRDEQKTPSKKILAAASVSFGGTKKIYRPLFSYIGLGLGTGSLIREYTKTNGDKTVEYVYVSEKDSRSWYLSPELGLIIDLKDFLAGQKSSNSWGISILAGLKYPIQLDKVEHYDYSNLVYTLGLGIGINNNKNIYRKDWSFFAYNFDLGSNTNLSLSEEDYISDKSLIGLSFGSLNNNKAGYYIAFRSNAFLYDEKKELNNYLKNGTLDENILDNKLSRESKAFLTMGITKKILYPVWIYTGAGISYYSASKQLTLLPDYSGKGRDVPGDKNTIIWAKDANAVSWGINPEVGVALNLGGLLLRGGVNRPIPLNKDDNSNSNLCFSFSIGYAWAARVK